LSFQPIQIIWFSTRLLFKNFIQFIILFLQNHEKFFYSLPFNRLFLPGLGISVGAKWRDLNLWLNKIKTNLSRILIFPRQFSRKKIFFQWNLFFENFFRSENESKNIKKNFSWRQNQKNPHNLKNRTKSIKFFYWIGKSIFSNKKGEIHSTLLKFFNIAFFFIKFSPLNCLFSWRFLWFNLKINQLIVG